MCEGVTSCNNKTDQQVLLIFYCSQVLVCLIENRHEEDKQLDTIRGIYSRGLVTCSNNPT